MTLTARPLTARPLTARPLTALRLGETADGGLYGNDFVLVARTTTASETFTIPCQNAGTFDAEIDWGDGSTSTITAYNDANLTHTYASAGDYTIKIRGTFPNIYFSNGGDKDKLISIENWGNTGFTRLNGAFFGCSNLVHAKSNGATNTSAVTNMFDMFRGCNSLTTLDVSGWNTSAVTNIGNMFYGCSGLTTLDVSGWDTSAATNMVNMFRDCTSLGPITISGWDITSLTGAASFMGSTSGLLTQTEYEATLVNWEAQSEQCQSDAVYRSHGRWVSSSYRNHAAE